MLRGWILPAFVGFAIGYIFAIWVLILISIVVGIGYGLAIWLFIWPGTDNWPGQILAAIYMQVTTIVIASMWVTYWIATGQTWMIDWIPNFFH